MASHPSRTVHPPDVELRLPADSAYVVRAPHATAGLAARLDFTLDDIEDLRIAVGEACAMVLPEARPRAPTWPAASACGRASSPSTCQRRVRPPRQPDRDGFAWQVLTTLATDASRPSPSDGRFTVSLRMKPRPDQPLT